MKPQAARRAITAHVAAGSNLQSLLLTTKERIRNLKNTESPAQGKRKKDDIRIYPEPTRIAKARETALPGRIVPSGAFRDQMRCPGQRVRRKSPMVHNAKNQKKLSPYGLCTILLMMFALDG